MSESDAAGTIFLTQDPTTVKTQVPLFYFNFKCFFFNTILIQIETIIPLCRGMNKLVLIKKLLALYVDDETFFNNLVNVYFFFFIITLIFIFLLFAGIYLLVNS